MSTKMKGLLKGLRYISQIFDNEKEQEMEIGYPTDVKHVAHIGWDGGPSVNSPSWMNEFKPTSEASSTENHEPNPEDSGLKDGQPQNSQGPRLPDMPRSSRRQSSTGASAVVTSEHSDVQKRSRRHHSSSSASSLPREATGKTKPRQPREGSQGSESPSRNPPDMPRKNRQKKSKDSSKDGGGSTRSRARSQTSNTYAPSPFSDPGCGTEPRFQSNETSAGLEGVGEKEEKKKCNEI